MWREFIHISCSYKGEGRGGWYRASIVPPCFVYHVHVCVCVYIIMCVCVGVYNYLCVGVCTRVCGAASVTTGWQLVISLLLILNKCSAKYSGNVKWSSPTHKYIDILFLPSWIIYHLQFSFIKPLQINKHRHTQVRIRTNTYTYTHTHTHTHIHTHTHTNTHK